ncbi:Uma2 family endonuclease [Magnetococcales bacterium HHB-1]
MDHATQSEQLTEEAYLESENISEVRHEYIDGYLYAMVGSSINHNRLSSTLVHQFGDHLKDKPCDLFQSTFKVKTSKRKFRYPDVIVRCDDPHDNHELYTEKPIIIVEVLSKSTRRSDKTKKMLEYINLPSLKEYVLIEQDIVDIEVLRRSNGWRSEHFYLGDKVILNPSV